MGPKKAYLYYKKLNAPLTGPFEIENAFKKSKLLTTRDETLNANKFECELLALLRVWTSTGVRNLLDRGTQWQCCLFGDVKECYDTL